MDTRQNNCQGTVEDAENYQGPVDPTVKSSRHLSENTSFNFDGYCNHCGMDKTFALSGIDILADNKTMMHGLCIECNNETLGDMGHTIWMRAKCPKCKVEISIMTFEEDPTEPLKSCGECGYAGELTVLETMQRQQT